METCLMCVGLNSADCEWCDDGVVPDDMLFKAPGEVKTKKSKPHREPELVEQPHSYQLIAFLTKGPSYHMVKSTNEYRSARTWCGLNGRVLDIEPDTVPRCDGCYTARLEDAMTAGQQVESRRSRKQ